ncbi:glycerophosphodiester phosphodiesterase [Pontibacter diazotrophicus]|uniref:Glycerophosphodiester phosphodiesterase n=1 Tax=Pontibacter diazotrophicus TaxID=1400979 RepID=A0A3D8L1B2_9BACT|nr:glycerophosphodiester phosphodiesterase [Pontibacter diazotrophicus]
MYAVKRPGKRRLQFLPKLVLLLAVLGVLIYMGLSFYYASKHKGADVLLLGHAGSGFFSPLNPFNPLPPNSRASIMKAMENGADGLEVDVQLSKDGVPVLYHDVTLASMTVWPEPDTIDNLPASAVVGLAYKGGFPYDLFHDEKIITLEELLQLFSTYPEPPYLHIDLRNHDASRHAYYAQTLMDMLRKYNYPLQKLAFISPNADFLEAFREVEPEAVLVIDTGGNYEQAMQTILARGFQGICANGRNVSPEQVQQAKQEGLLVVLFGGKSNARISKMIAMEPDVIQVDDVVTMRRMLD